MKIFSVSVTDIFCCLRTALDTGSSGGELRITKAEKPETEREAKAELIALFKELLSVSFGLRGPDGRIAVPFELVFGHAWCPPAKRRADGYQPLPFVRSAGRPGTAGVAGPAPVG